MAGLLALTFYALDRVEQLKVLHCGITEVLRTSLKVEIQATVLYYLTQLLM